MSHAPTDALRRRHRAVRDDCAARGLDALVVTSLPNILYLTNFTGSSAIAVLTPDGVHFITDFRYVTALADSQRTPFACPELELVTVLPMYEQEQAGVLYNTAAVVDADGTYLGKYRKHHIPQVKGFWEKFYFRPGNLGFPVFDTAVGKVGVYICYDRHFPEGWRALGLNGAEIVFNPSATSRGLSSYLWRLEQPAAAVANEYYIGAINRVGVEPLGDNDFYGQSYFADPRGQIIGGTASDTAEEVIVRDLDMGLLEEVRNLWQFYRDRRPDSYGPLAQP